MPFSRFSFAFFLGMLAACGCQDTNRSQRSTHVNSATSRDQLNDQNLQNAFDVLRNTGEFQTADSLLTVVGRLNQWTQQKQPLADWQPEPILETLPQDLRDLPTVRNLAELKFPPIDGPELQQTIWLSAIAERARGQESQPLPIAQALFDWVVRNEQIERDVNMTVPHLPREVLVLGHGTASDRAWIFTLLARQQGLDVVELAIAGKEPTDEPRLWTSALFLDGELYLFDTRLGLPIAGPEGKPVATLRDVLTDESLLRSMDLDPQRLYPIHAEDLQHVVALVEASPMYISQRMQLVETELPGKETLVLTARPSALAEQVKSHPGITGVQAWRLPYDRLKKQTQMDRETQAKFMAEVAPFQVPSSVLWQARVLHLLGSFDGDKGANALYQSARPSDADLKSYRDKAPEKTRPKVENDVARMKEAKQSASYWLGLIAFERGNYPTAVDYFETRTLEAAPEGPWTAGARYNLARSLEAMGRTDEAVRYYKADLSAQRQGNMLRAQRLEGTKKTPESANQETEASPQASAQE
jgi:tetratricopeptide (TPR) repeat protein